MFCYLFIIHYSSTMGNGICKAHKVVPADWATWTDDNGAQVWGNWRDETVTYEPHECEWIIDSDGNWYNRYTAQWLTLPEEEDDSGDMSDIPLADATPIAQVGDNPGSEVPVAVATVSTIYEVIGE